MNTAARINAVAAAFGGRADLGFANEADLQNLIVTELGHADILDQPVLRGNVTLMARPPHSIYHLCASNLAVSAETSLLLGLLLGSQLYFKLPSGGLEAFVKTVEGLPAALREKVTLLSQHDSALMAAAAAVVVYGSDETIATIHRQIHWRQRFLGYGHKISLGLIEQGDETPEIAAAAAREVLAYEQLGCLSPQAYLCRNPESCEKFAALLATALAEQRQTQPLPKLDFDQAALRQHFHQSAAARGEKVLAGADGEYLVISGARQLETGPAHAAVSVLSSWEIPDAVSWNNKLSAVSHSSPLAPEVIATFTNLGVSRFCPTGNLQNPPLAWHHDTRPRLADLVRWVTFG
ncbi:MAG: hypothetical protein LBH01_11915 [Verrucomicrobiales bacterium]|jgi:hypothetical protein|nr:hypothetical protein [Verrucomicrobiales bacterium]